MILSDREVRAAIQRKVIWVTPSPPALEIWNISPFKIRIQRGMPSCQIIFEEVHGIPEGPYAGQFALQGPG